MEEFPVPIRFELPGPQWRAVQPESVGVSNAMFVALRDDTPGDYTPIISFSGGWRTDDATMEQIAEEAVLRLRDETGDAQLMDRRQFGTEQTPSYSQVLRASAEVDGQHYDLARLQALIGLQDPAQERRRAVLIVSCTCLADQLDVVTPEFQALVKGLRVDEAKAAG
ncbi:hypothetical protein [uncultured Nocardioides sp.]|uniref:hypothetical protein n=1 Tax=uncultured Nocardioides sp. TaxID=198441 RepID=UPI00261998EB|nr:hypothetical protein [uncultured Nocardioides sp.]